jgi:hypothetical protein
MPRSSDATQTPGALWGEDGGQSTPEGTQREAQGLKSLDFSIKLYRNVVSVFLDFVACFSVASSEKRRGISVSGYMGIWRRRGVDLAAAIQADGERRRAGPAGFILLWLLPVFSFCFPLLVELLIVRFSSLSFVFSWGHGRKAARRLKYKQHNNPGALQTRSHWNHT